MEQNSSLKRQLVSKSAGRWVIILTIGAALVTSIVVLKNRSRSHLVQPNPSLTSTSTVRAVSALGRLEPLGEVIKLSAPRSVQGQGARVVQLLVKEGDQVRTNQVVVILDQHESKQATLFEANRLVQVDQANLAKVKAGAKQGEIDAQKATIARLKAQLKWEIVSQQAMIARLQAQQKTQTRSQEAAVARIDAQLRNAQIEEQRYQNLYKAGGISASEYDSKRLSVQTADKQTSEAEANLNQTIETLLQQINEAKANLDKTIATSQQQIKEAEANLDRIKEVRPTDIQAAQAQVEHSLAAVKQAQADLNLSYIRSSIDGQVLKIHTWPGESVNDKGIADLGQTAVMVAVAEINENDIGKVRLGQRATITSDYGAFSEKLQGTVIKIGKEISKKDALNTDPAADTDARVVEVKIRIDPQDSQRVTDLTYAKVAVKIKI